MSKDVLGHIDCPTCGTAKGMRITHDKNGEPFGYCEANCNQQMRIGGDKRRVAAFAARYPWAMPPAAPVTDTEKKPATPNVANATPNVAAPAPASKPAKPRSPFDDALKALGVA